MSQNQSAVVVVRKDWINTKVRHLINYGRDSGSLDDTHLVIGDLARGHVGSSRPLVEEHRNCLTD